MPRRREVPKREILPDPKFGNVDVAKFVNILMLSGKKSVAESIIYGAFDIIADKTGKEPLEVFAQAVNNCKPIVEVKSRRVGGANYQIPFPIAGHRQLHFAFSWLVQSARARGGMPYAKRLEAEIVDAYNETGAAFKKKEDCHRMAEANRAFAHFAR